MKSGLEGRNNSPNKTRCMEKRIVSMKSGLEGRNNRRPPPILRGLSGLNEVRPRRPEQRAKCYIDKRTDGASQ